MPDQSYVLVVHGYYGDLMVFGPFTKEQGLVAIRRECDRWNANTPGTVYELSITDNEDDMLFAVFVNRKEDPEASVFDLSDDKSCMELQPLRTLGD